jgi:hypothetical protein
MFPAENRKGVDCWDEIEPLAVANGREVREDQRRDALSLRVAQSIIVSICKKLLLIGTKEMSLHQT